MSSFFCKPTGNLIKGHVLDAAVGPLVEALRLYDPQLYVRWNPRKLRGWGIWEVRRQPDFKSLRRSKPPIKLKTGEWLPPVQGDVYEFEGMTITTPKYHELDIINHVMDAPYLNYLMLEKIKRMDMWTKDELGYQGKKLNEALEYNEAKHLEKIDQKSSEELDYNLKQHKSEIRYFKEYVNSGGNPYRLADYWPK